MDCPCGSTPPSEEKLRTSYDVRVGPVSTPSEEKKCCEKCVEALPNYEYFCGDKNCRCHLDKLFNQYLKQNESVPCHSPTQEEKCLGCEFVKMGGKYNPMNPAQHTCTDTPTPPDAWEEEATIRYYNHHSPLSFPESHRDFSEFIDWLRSKKKEWEEQARQKEARHWAVEPASYQKGRTTTLEEVIGVVDDERQKWHEGSSYYLALGTVLTRLKEMRNK